jgi:hypothetical protein
MPTMPTPPASTTATRATTSTMPALAGWRWFKPEAGQGLGMQPDECMFCHGPIPAAAEVPENLAFMSHLEQAADCRSAFDTWTGHMQRDFLGD